MHRSRPLLFASLPADEMEHLCARISPWQASKGSTIYTEGEEVKGLYLIDVGRVQFDLHSFEGRRLVVGFLGPGHVFGDVELIEGSPALTSAVAAQAVTGWWLSAADFHNTLIHTPHFNILMMRSLARNTRLHHLLYRHSVLMSPDERLAMALLALERQQHPGDPNDGGHLIRTTQDSLALVLGTTRQCVSKHLKQWETDGWIAIHYGGIQITNRVAIAALLQRG